MRFTNRHNLPKTIVAALTADAGRKRTDGVFSVTELSDSPLIAALWREHYDDIEVDVSDRLWMIYGSGVHYRLELAAGELGDEMIAEHFIEIDLEGRTLRGKIDVLLRCDDGTWRIEDHKTTSVFAAMKLGKDQKPTWAMQTNLYADMARRNGFEVHSLHANMILRDWRQWEARREGNQGYPPIPFMHVEVPMWDDGEALKAAFQRMRMIEENVEALRAGKEPPYLCTPEDRWSSRDIWAVMKKGRKTAIPGGLKTCPDEAASLAQRKGKDHYVEYRPGEHKRCAMCEVRDFCPMMQNGG